MRKDRGGVDEEDDGRLSLVGSSTVSLSLDSKSVRKESPLRNRSLIDAFKDDDGGRRGGEGNVFQLSFLSLFEGVALQW